MRTYYTDKHALQYNQTWETFLHKTLGAVSTVIEAEIRLRDRQGGQPVRRILDAGCGTGLLLERMAHLFPLAELYGIDGSQEMLTQARQQLHGFANVHLSCVRLPNESDAALPYPPAFFDLITCTNVLHYVQNPSSTLSSFKTMLTTQGKLILEDYVLRGFPFPCKWFEWAVRLYDPEHQTLLSRPQAQCLCERVGLPVTTARSFPIDLFCQGWIIHATQAPVS